MESTPSPKKKKAFEEKFPVVIGRWYRCNLIKKRNTIIKITGYEEIYQCDVYKLKYGSAFLIKKSLPITEGDLFNFFRPAKKPSIHGFDYSEYKLL
jgi:hypothetical protein